MLLRELFFLFARVVGLSPLSKVVRSLMHMLGFIDR